jgi:hypothetical protein
VSRWLHFSTHFANACVDDGKKLIGLEAGATDEDTVYTVLPKKRSGIFRFDAATILDRKLLGPCLSTDLTELAANEHMRIMRLLRGRMVFAIADRPRGFVCDA